MYGKMIQAVLGCDAAKARYVEAWMILEKRTLDGLSRAQFSAEAKVCEKCVDASTKEENEELARSFGVRTSEAVC